MTEEPLVFEPIPMERVWGGRRMETVLGKNLPHGVPIGESWELVDREDAQSVVHEGPLAGKTLHELWTHHRLEVFGADHASHPAERFPILIKILDARERLSVQVHPPARLSSALNGDPKTEMWYFLDSQPSASVYAGLKRGVTRDAFEGALIRGGVEHLLHRIPAATGESIFIPSGRLHAIAEGCLIIEVQQNSDTTYRVYDWNRLGLDGRPRALHIPESMASIDFDDFEPELTPAAGEVVSGCPYFLVERWELDRPRPALDTDAFAFFSVVEGHVACGGRVFARGEMFLVPACNRATMITSSGGPATVLRTTLPVH